MSPEEEDESSIKSRLNKRQALEATKKINWMSRRISIGRPLEYTGRPVELLYGTSTRAEDLAEYFLQVITSMPPNTGRPN